MSCRKALGVVQVLLSSDKNFPLSPTLLSTQMQNTEQYQVLWQSLTLPAQPTTTVQSQTLTTEQRLVLNSAKRRIKTQNVLWVSKYYKVNWEPEALLVQQLSSLSILSISVPPVVFETIFSRDS